ncbi:MAG: type II secretion system protein [Pirellulaceae bacterium]
MKGKPFRGQTMLELLAATSIISIALIPALRLTRESNLQLEQIELAEMRVALCTSKLEEAMAQTAASWDLSTQTGNFSSVGHPDLWFQVQKSDEAAEGGVPDRLATIEVTVWHDVDGGGDLDADEPSNQLATKLAKIISYGYEATIH